MSDSITTAPAKREYTQLLRLHEHLLDRLQEARDELTAPGTDDLIRTIRARTGSAPDLAPVRKAIEEAIRALKLSESGIRGAVINEPEHAFELDGITNIPAYLQRFLAERAANPRFHYEVMQDEVRGWVVCWKEYTEKGTVRGYGQFYERPYAWLED